MTCVALQAVLPRMTHQDPTISSECQKAVRQLLISDAEGKMAREAVQLAADLVRVRKCVCDPAVVRVLLVLDLAEAEPGGCAYLSFCSDDSSMCQDGLLLNGLCVVCLLSCLSAASSPLQNWLCPYMYAATGQALSDGRLGISSAHQQ